MNIKLITWNDRKKRSDTESLMPAAQVNALVFACSEDDLDAMTIA
ncbi:hypothetical protein [Methylomicrobium lacus]|nr:hypothetical protein [Methylomicrobium lacus]